jgi:molybdenum cofactor cytidylyltransferase
VKKSIHAVVLAAGLSTRMGSPKQLLPFGEKTLLQSVLDLLSIADLDGIHVILGHRSSEIAGTLEGRNVSCVENPRYREGMLSSIHTGLTNLPASADFLMLVLGDQPHLESSVIAALVEACQTSKKGIIIPVFDGKRGHPILLDLARYRTPILEADPHEGLKPIVRSNTEDTLEIAVSDGGILRDIDTRDDYLKEMERLKPGSTSSE